MDETAALERLRQLEIETPSWGYGNSGTRFHVYPWPGAARDVSERIADAALVHRLTGSLPARRAAHPLGRGRRLRRAPRARREQGIGIGAINPNLFGDDDYRLGSLCHPDRAVRQKAIQHCRDCIGSRSRSARRSISLWLADGTNYPGQDDCAGATRVWSTGSSRSTRRFRQACVCSSSTSSSSRASTAPTSPTGARRRCSAGASVRRRRCSSTPATTRRGRTSSRSCGPARRGAARRLPLQQPQVRRRRPDRRLDRPVRALPDHARDRRGRRRERRVHDRPVAQHRREDRRDDPVGDEHPDRIREGAARRRGSACPTRSGPATCSRPTVCCSRRTRPTCARSSFASAGASACRTIRSRPSARAATPTALARARGTASVESAYERH